MAVLRKGAIKVALDIPKSAMEWRAFGWAVQAAMGDRPAFGVIPGRLVVMTLYIHARDKSDHIGIGRLWTRYAQMIWRLKNVVATWDIACGGGYIVHAPEDPYVLIILEERTCP